MMTTKLFSAVILALQWLAAAVPGCISLPGCMPPPVDFSGLPSRRRGALGSPKTTDQGRHKTKGETMKLPFLNIEVFHVPAASHQRGYWVDRLAGQWVALGLWRTVLTLARLPDKKP